MRLIRPGERMTQFDVIPNPAAHSAHTRDFGVLTDRGWRGDSIRGRFVMDVAAATRPHPD
jgi:hypothetical protein